MWTAKPQRSVNTMLTTVLSVVLISSVRYSNAAYAHSYFNSMSERYITFYLTNAGILVMETRNINFSTIKDDTSI